MLWVICWMRCCAQCRLVGYIGNAREGMGYRLSAIRMRDGLWTLHLVPKELILKKASLLIQLYLSLFTDAVQKIKIHLCWTAICSPTTLSKKERNQHGYLAN